MTDQAEPTRDDRADREPMAHPDGSPELSPNDHLKLMLTVLDPGSMPMIRRWVGALLLAPEAARQEIVEAVERQMVEEFGDRRPD